ncbi:MAG TPA: hypothetical protein VFK36_11410 [Gemmatimonadales bacterium]|nr:hypothetical protein [Gemmatimonadales bacterium]
MTPFGSLWLPILLSAVAVFIVSSIVHMALQFWHRNDYRKLPNEDAVLAALRPFEIPPGDYMAPQCDSMAEMKSPEFLAKWQAGPAFMATFFPRRDLSMGPQLLGWFLYTLVINALAGLLACHVLAPGTAYLPVFHIVALAAFLGYAGALWPQSIWYHRNWGTTIRSTIDGLLYALVTAGVFGWLWPR